MGALLFRIFAGIWAPPFFFCFWHLFSRPVPRFRVCFFFKPLYFLFGPAPPKRLFILELISLALSWVVFLRSQRSFFFSLDITPADVFSFFFSSKGRWGPRFSISLPGFSTQFSFFSFEAATRSGSGPARNLSTLSLSLFSSGPDFSVKDKLRDGYLFPAGPLPDFCEFTGSFFLSSPLFARAFRGFFFFFCFPRHLFPKIFPGFSILLRTAGSVFARPQNFLAPLVSSRTPPPGVDTFVDVSFCPSEHNHRLD